MFVDGLEAPLTRRSGAPYLHGHMEAPTYALEFEKPLRELMKQLDELRQRALETNIDSTSEIRALEKKIEAAQRDIYSNLTTWQRVLIARHPKRPYALDYIQAICENFQE